MILESKSKTKILSISGSVRKASINSLLLRCAAKLAPENIQIEPFIGLDAFPIFNPDLEATPPNTVLNFRARLREADAVLIASPEYAHGVTGAMKNALDWVVGSGELVAKPVGLLNASLLAKLAYAALKETLSAMDVHLIEESSVNVPLYGKNVTEADVLENSEKSAILRQAVISLAHAAAAAVRNP